MKGHSHYVLLALDSLVEVAVVHEMSCLGADGEHRGNYGESCPLDD